jgi:predicted PurR-regulated permease PerM
MTMHVPTTPDEPAVPDGAPAPASPPAAPETPASPQPSSARAARARVSVAITPRSLWFAAGVVLVLLVLVLLVTHALGALALIFIAVILGEAIRPIVARLQTYHIPGPIAVLLIFLAVFVVLGAFFWLLLNPLVQQLGTLSNQFPHYVTEFQKKLTGLEQFVGTNPSLKDAVRQASTQLASLAQQAVPLLVSVPITVLTGVFGLLLSTVIVITMTLFWLGTSARLKPFVVGLFPSAKRELVSDVIAKLSKSLGGWVRGTLIQMLVIGTLTGLGLFILDVPYALLLGIVAGIIEIIPYLGPWISGSIAVVVTLIATGDPLKALEVIALFLVIQTIEGNVVQPLVMSRAVHLDPFLVIVAVLIGGELLGVIGVILAVPVAAVLQIMAVEIVAPAIRLASGHDTDTSVPATDHATDQTVDHATDQVTRDPSTAHPTGAAT